MNDTVINSDVINAPKACKNTLGILKNSTFLTVLQGQEWLEQLNTPAHLADMVMSGKSICCPGPTAPLAGAWVAMGG